MKIGDKSQLKVFSSPDSSHLDINWTTSDSKVVKVDKNGLVTAVGNGNASVTATVEGITATSQFVVGNN
ncbi:MAG: Ig-like domain-containing protein [Clostridium sp.]